MYCILGAMNAAHSLTTHTLMRRPLLLAAALCCALFCSAVCHTPALYGQPVSLDNAKGFFFDALTFRGTTDSLQRMDVFAIVPYQHLQFVKQGEQFAGRFTVTMNIRDSTGAIVKTDKHTRTVSEASYEATIGATARFDYVQSVFYVHPGMYAIDVTVYDELAKKDNTRSRKLSVLPFERFPFSLSSVMLASSIAQTTDGLTVTPHITDDVTMLLEDDLFVFFESYWSSGIPDTALFLYEIVGDKGTILHSGTMAKRFVGAPRLQHYLKIDLPGSLGTGTYTIRVLALRPGTPQSYTREAILAASEHSIRIDAKVGYGPAGPDELDASIRQLRYVASDQEKEFIEAGTTVEERRTRFLEFWKKIDPTGNTQRNEAYEQYYQRVEYANKNFRSYTEGWLTDMGMVYIILGPPNDVQRQSYRTDGKIVEVWYYPQNRQIVFVDYSGFGDFRLAGPLGSSDKYRYSP